ncbi:hypothetical protein [Sphingomonas azotifigens]|uniref:hypothetical protein n=1 Tax=Sphingomonas azotifigens TaxID=330920 RepID=UPI001C3FD3B3|nr:hypothetical protein [Sphingomonas azotifigens]
MGIIAFQMPMTEARWFYRNQGACRSVDVEVEHAALERLNQSGTGDALPYAIFTANRAAIERAARNIIDREGPNFAEPIQVTANDI